MGDIVPIEPKNNSTILKALPVQLIEVNEAIIVKRGCTEVRFSGEGSQTIVRDLLSFLSSDGATRQEIFVHFKGIDQTGLEQLIDHLMHKRILVSCDDAMNSSYANETPLGIFYWHFGTNAAKVADNINRRHIGILGVNYISRQLAISFSEVGVKNFEIIDHPRLRNRGLFNKSKNPISDPVWPLPRPILDYAEWSINASNQSYDCIIATSDFGEQQPLEEWNAWCVKRKILFFPIVLQNLVGYVGPLVIPQDTACFACLQTRQNSHMESPSLMRAGEQVAFEGQSIIGFHPAMASILGDITSFELTKFFSGELPAKNIGKLIEVNLLATAMTVRKVLKVPRCPVCSPLLLHSSNRVSKTSFGLAN